MSTVIALPFTERPVIVSGDTCPHCGAPLAEAEPFDLAEYVTVDGERLRVVDKTKISGKTVTIKTEKGRTSAACRVVPVVVVAAA